jgi:hypothetical protein
LISTVTVNRYQRKLKTLQSNRPWWDDNVEDARQGKNENVTSMISN